MFDVKATTSRAATDCGAACMVSFLDYYGIEKTIDEMRKELNTRISGCSGKDLLVCGRKYGLDMRAYGEGEEWEGKGTGETVDIDILDQDRPAICLWKYNHWIVFCGMDDKGKVVIMNPSRGRYSISQSLFRAFFSNFTVTNGKPEELPKE